MNSSLELQLWDSPRGQVEVNPSPTGWSLSWIPRGVGEAQTLAEFQRADGIVRIFPKVTRGLDFDDQYDQIRELLVPFQEPEDMEYLVGEGDRGELELTGLPDGFGKIPAFGLGMPRKYRGFARAVEDATQCTILEFSRDRAEGPDGDTFRTQIQRFARYKHDVDRNERRVGDVQRRLNKAEAANSIAELVGAPLQSPALGKHPTIKAITRALSDGVPLDSSERLALVNRMSAETESVAREDPEAFGRLRSEVDLVSLDVLIDRYAKNLRGKAAKDEPLWQSFFEQNEFALQQIFATPVALYGEQLNVRIATVKDSGRRVADFVLVNPVANTMIIVEIKTPSTPLIGKKYRGTGGAEVFPPHKELSNAVAQLQSQMDSAVTDLPTLIRQTPGLDEFSGSSVKGAVLVGKLSGLEDEQRQSLMRFRDGLHGVEVLAFDEVHERLKSLHDLLAHRAEDHLKP